MKIGMMSLWNAANGPSIHAEFIGREWIKRGHSLVVFSARKHPDFRPTQQEEMKISFSGILMLMKFFPGQRQILSSLLLCSKRIMRYL
ncbi:hypothetical protein ES705_06151 [subsurface metagenome]|nr:hypothetical protein [Methanosarcinales archaeon]